MKKLFTITLALSVSATLSAAEDCSTYPFDVWAHTVGAHMPAGEEAGKILLTGMALTGRKDSVEVKMDAIQRATKLAKSHIMKFWQEDIAEACTTGEAVETVVKWNSNVSSKQRTEVDPRICQIHSQSPDIIRGATVIGSCYTPGQYALVTVGINTF